MDITVIIQAIGSVGFPIVAFFVSIYCLKYSFDASREDNSRAFKQVAELSKSINTLAEAVNNNTKVLTSLVDNDNIKVL